MARDLKSQCWSSRGVGVGLSGVLSEPRDGHPAGTPYVVIQAACVDDAIFAEEWLGDVARVPVPSWHGTWEVCAPTSEFLLQRPIYPNADELRELLSV